MKRASKRIHGFLATAVAVTTWATPGAAFPWDAPLEALQQTLVGPVAHSLIAMSFIGAIFAYAIAGDSQVARRLARAGLGVSVALSVLGLMNYFLP
jgi:type IV secretory pathway VirB2 component (pilin)